jgi:hypothetical protein
MMDKEHLQKALYPYGRSRFFIIGQIKTISSGRFPPGIKNGLFSSIIWECTGKNTLAGIKP